MSDEVVDKVRHKYNVKPYDFVVAWNSSKTTAEVSAKLNMPKNIVLARAANYRKVGVNLKTLERSRSNRINVEELNKIINDE